MSEDNKEIEQANLEAVKKEAAELGITFRPSAGIEAIQKKITEFYANAEAETNSGGEVSETAVITTESAHTAAKRAAQRDMRQTAKDLEAAARKTRVVVIVDNDQRVNNVATSCTANCSNAYFDLGTIILPLNTEVEVREGHLASLADVRIPQHVKDPANPAVSRTVMRSRYSIQTVDNVVR